MTSHSRKRSRDDDLVQVGRGEFDEKTATQVVKERRRSKNSP